MLLIGLALADCGEVTEWPDPLGTDPVAWSTNNLTAVHTSNGPPTAFNTGLHADGVVFEVRVDQGQDDDFIGFVVNNAQTVLVDWRQADEDSTCGTALAGLALSTVGADADGEDLWCHSGAVVEQAGAMTLGSTGWEHERTYRFELRDDQVFVDGQLEFQGIDLDGELSFYNFSQRNARYRLVEPRQDLLCPPGTWSGGWCAGTEPGNAAVLFVVALFWRRREASS